jgi:cephalosporin hydroxylase
MIEGSSIDRGVWRAAAIGAEGREPVLVCLDSNHTHDHVLAELELYAPLVTVDSYCVVFDTIVEHLPDDAYPDRPWGPGNSPGSAVKEFLQGHPEFATDSAIDSKLMISVAPGGYLTRRA